MEEDSDVIAARFVSRFVSDNSEIFRGSVLNHSGEIRLQVTGDFVVDVFHDNVGPKAASDIISGFTVEEEVCMEIYV